jgi:hypothetical protein
MKKTLPFSINMTNIPEGTHSITVYAYTICEYETGRENVRAPVSPSGFLVGNFLYIYSNFYRIAGSSSVNFTIDTSPKITPNINNNSGPYYGTNVLLYAIGITTLLIVAAGLLVYHKKHKLSLVAV